MIENLEIEQMRKIYDYQSKVGKVKYVLPENKTPFIVLLHSLGKNETSVIKFSNLLPKNSFVLSIKAPIDWKVDGDESFAWFDVKGPWIENFCKESDILNSIEYIRKVIDECIDKFPYLDDPTIIGFSQGGIVALTAAVENLLKVKAVYSHCGFYENKLNRQLNDIRTPILMTNGKSDNIISEIWVRQSHEILTQKCSNFESKFYDIGHEITKEVIEDMIKWLNKLYD